VLDPELTDVMDADCIRGDLEGVGRLGVRVASPDGNESSRNDSLSSNALVGE
jgi:hypothetical protein